MLRCGGGDDGHHPQAGRRGAGCVFRNIRPLLRHLLPCFPVEDWHGGKVQRIRPSVIHLMRGQIYDIQGKTLTISWAGGGTVENGLRVGPQKMFENSGH